MQYGVRTECRDPTFHFFEHLMMNLSSHYLTCTPGLHKVQLLFYNFHRKHSVNVFDFSDLFPSKYCSVSSVFSGHSFVHQRLKYSLIDSNAVAVPKFPKCVRVREYRDLLTRCYVAGPIAPDVSPKLLGVTMYILLHKSSPDIAPIFEHRLQSPLSSLPILLSTPSPPDRLQLDEPQNVDDELGIVAMQSME